jgi:hypothetical protein
MMGRVPLKLAGGGSRSPESRRSRRRLEERKINNGVKMYSGSRLIQSNLVSQTCLTDGLNMSDDLILDNLS